MPKPIFLAIVVILATSVYSADSLYIYERGVRKYTPVDTIQVLVKWDSFLGQLGQTGWLATYPSIDPNRYEPFKADDYFLHSLTGSYEYNAVVAQLEADPHVLAVNQVLDVGAGLSIYIGDRIICRFAPGTSRATIDSLFLANQLSITEEWQDAPNQFTVEVGTSSPFGTLDMANYLEELPAVEWAHPNWKGNCTLHGYTLYDSLFHIRQWNVKKSVDYKGASNAGAWEVTRGSSSVKVAVLDAGMERHEDFNMSLWLTGRDYWDGDTIPDPIFPEPDSIREAHGMAVLGLIAAAHNNPVNTGIGLGELSWQSTAGVSPGVSIIRERIFKPWDEGVDADSVAHALYYAVNSGADVINCSWDTDLEFHKSLLRPSTAPSTTGATERGVF